MSKSILAKKQIWEHIIPLDWTIPLNIQSVFESFKNLIKQSHHLRSLATNLLF